MGLDVYLYKVKKKNNNEFKKDNNVRFLSFPLYFRKVWFILDKFKYTENTEFLELSKDSVGEFIDYLDEILNNPYIFYKEFTDDDYPIVEDVYKQFSKWFNQNKDEDFAYYMWCWW